MANVSETPARLSWLSATREAKRPSDLGMSGDDLVVEYDEGVLRALKERDDFI